MRTQEQQQPTVSDFQVRGFLPGNHQEAQEEMGHPNKRKSGNKGMHFWRNPRHWRNSMAGAEAEKVEKVHLKKRKLKSGVQTERQMMRPWGTWPDRKRFQGQRMWDEGEPREIITQKQEEKKCDEGARHQQWNLKEVSETKWEMWNDCLISEQDLFQQLVRREKLGWEIWIWQGGLDE